MKSGKIRELGARLGARFPYLWRFRFRLAVFVLLFLIFFAVNQFLLGLPEKFSRALNALPMARVVYSDSAVHVFPPELELTDVAIVHPASGDVLLRLDGLTIRPGLLRLFSGRVALRFTALSGGGSAVLDASTGGSFDFSAASFSLSLTDMPLRALGSLERYDPDIDGALSARVTGETAWNNASGRISLRGFNVAANGSVSLASVRNNLEELAFGRFRAGVLNFDLALAERTLTVRRLDLTEGSCQAALGGRVLLNLRNMANSELDLTGELRAAPEQVAPALLLNSEVRGRLGQGQPLPFTMQGTIGDMRIKPVL